MKELQIKIDRVIESLCSGNITEDDAKSRLYFIMDNVMEGNNNE